MAMGAAFRIGVGLVDLDRRTIKKTSGVQRLSTKEAAVFRVLASSPGVTVSREDLLEGVWGAKAYPGNTIAEVVYRLRKKVERDASQPEHILTLHGEGFVFMPLAVDEPSQAADMVAPEVTLPVPPPGFVGRTAELQWLADALKPPGSLVSIIGPGGAGKTALAIQLAHNWTSTASARVYFFSGVELGAGEDIGTLIARGLGRDAQLAPADLSQCMCPGDLLVFDNAEHLKDQVADWVERSGALRWLVTAREPLALHQEQCMRLEGLSRRDAMSLFEASARRKASSVELNDDIVGAIVDAIECAPLAIEMAAGLARTRSLGKILEALGEPLNLKSRDRRAPRHSSINAVLAWSWDLLGVAEREGLCQLAMLRSDFDLNTATDWAGEGLVDALMDKSWIRGREGGRYGMPSAVVAFVEGTQSEQGLAERAGRHAAFFASICTEIDTTSADFHAHPVWGLEADLWAALPHVPDSDGRVAILVALSHVSPSLDRVVSELAAETPDASCQTRASGLLALGDCEDERGQYGPAADAYRGIAAFLPPDHPIAMSAQACLLGIQMKSNEKSTAQTESALLGLVASGDPACGIRARRSLSFGLRWDGREADAAQLLREALDIAQRQAGPLVVAILQAELADIHLQTCALDKAGELFEAAALAFSVFSPKRAAWCTANLGVVRLEEGRHEDAEALLRSSQRDLQAVGAWTHVGIHSLNLCILHLVRGEHDDAIVEARKAGRHLTDSPLILGAPAALEAAAHAALGAPEEARFHANRAVTLQDAAESGVRRVFASIIDVLVAAALGEPTPENVPDVSEVRLVLTAAAAVRTAMLQQ
jgi:DNA-binding winged helix-turn-helix (wHTH) protein/tetratricopeptide (TPR) repeat protein